MGETKPAKRLSWTARKIIELANALDMSRKLDAPIRVRLTRRTPMKYFSPRERGGQLYYRNHTIVTSMRQKPCAESTKSP